jgi:putative flippase GtrA
MLLRFFRFNVVGAMGVAVQLASLTLLVSGLGVHYLPATAIAIELSLLHNFLWHERWTWRERRHNAECTMQGAECSLPAVAAGDASKAEPGPRRSLPAWFDFAHHALSRGRRAPAAACTDSPGGRRRRFARLAAFHAGNGLVSMAGSLALMPLLVSGLHLHYVAANVGTIAATGPFNFLLGDRIIFTASADGLRDAATRT